MPKTIKQLQKELREVRAHNKELEESYDDMRDQRDFHRRFIESELNAQVNLKPNH